MRTGNMYREFGKIWLRGFWHMGVDRHTQKWTNRQTHTHTDRNTTHSCRQQSNTIVNNTVKQVLLHHPRFNTHKAAANNDTACIVRKDFSFALVHTLNRASRCWLHR